MGRLFLVFSRGSVLLHSALLGRAAAIGLMSFSALVITMTQERQADAFCRTYTCDPTHTTCPIDPKTSCPTGGVALSWSMPCLSFSLQQKASKQAPFATFQQIADQAFAAWANVQCEGGQLPSVAFYDRGAVSCTKHEYNENQGNANILMFRNDDGEGWPYDGAVNALALTTLTFNTQTGEIYDADMEINGSPQEGRLTTTDADVDVDLRSVITHEAGHFIGIAHSSNKDATMYAIYKPGTTSLRTLSEDDRAAVCAIYPTNRPNLLSCDDTPRHGYATECASPGSAHGCSVTWSARHEESFNPRRDAVVLSMALLSLGTVIKRRRSGYNVRSRAARVPSV